MSIRPRRLTLATLLLIPAVLLAACGSGTTTASPSASAAAVASPLATPVASAVPSASSSAAPVTPAPSYLPGKPATPAASAALTAYFKAVADPAKSFHMVQSADVSVNGASAGKLDYTLDVNGIDFKAVASGLGVDLQLVALGDSMWVKQGTADWQKNPRDNGIITDITGVFEYVTSADDLVFLDTATQAGAKVHHFSIDAPLPYQTASMKTSGIVGSIPKMELFIADDGAPIRFTFTSEADATANGQAQHVESVSTVDVTKFGDKITIKAPV
jgi:hypothetical protein